ncbi:MAG TPA: alpha-amylase family glycosyl hydrolase [bacterium]
MTGTGFTGAVTGTFNGLQAAIPDTVDREQRTSVSEASHAGRRTWEEAAMPFADEMLSRIRPEHIRNEVHLPRRQDAFSSPVDWRDEVLYFLLVDRFSDGQEATRPLLDRGNLAAARPALASGEPWRFDRWAQSGAERWQGGTLQGVKSKLPYLSRLGVTTLWLSPVFKQRGHLDTYHGYGIQDFLDVDPRFGTRADFVELVAAAHAQGIRIIQDIIFNHSGANWLYPGDVMQPPFRPFPGHYDFGRWRGSQGTPVEAIGSGEDGVWPRELQDPGRYTRAGSGNLGAGDICDPHAEHKRTDFEDLRDFNLETRDGLADLARCYKYWIALSDCDGFRIDTLKHVSLEEARTFCGTIKEFAANLGKRNFLLIGEVAGGDFAQDRYLDVLTRNLDAALDIGGMRLTLNQVAKGLAHPDTYFSGFNPGCAEMGSHRNLGNKHVSILDDHDHVFGEKIRYSSEAASTHQVVAGVALQLFTLGIPCLYYGTEQAFAGPEPSERQWLPGWKASDRYLREAMFGPVHPRKTGRDGLEAVPAGLDPDLPGFGPFGTAGQHCFDEAHPAFRRIAALAGLRAAVPALRQGRQYLRPISFLGKPFAVYGPAEIVAWSRILDDEEVVCILNSHGTASRGADVLVDAALNGNSMHVLANTAQAADPAGFTGDHPAGSVLTVQGAADGNAFITVRDLGPSELLVVSNYPLD